MAVRLPVLPLPPDVDPGRIRVLERLDRLLVMDRISGRWVYLPRELLPAVQLLGTPEAVLPSVPEPVRQLVRDLRGTLRQRGVGVPGSERRFGGLNTVIIKLTNACNLACRYCYDFEQDERATRLEAETARRAVAEALALCDGRLEVILHGGEPMLAWGLIEDLVTTGEALARERGVVLRFVGQTNMTRLSGRIVEFSTTHGIEWGMSHDGSPAIQDRLRVLRDGSGSHELFLAALAEWPGFVRRCSVMTTITAATEGLLLPTARYFRDLGMAAWDWSLFQPIGRARSESALAFDVDRVIASWNELFDAVLAGEFDGFPVLPVLKYVRNFRRGPGANMCLRPECGAARDLVSISADGTVEACDCIDPKGPMAGLGRLGQVSLAEALDSEPARRIRARDVSHLRCGDCVWFGVCGGTCMAHAGAVDAIWDDGCAVALNAFDRIADAYAADGVLDSYLASLGEK